MNREIRALSGAETIRGGNPVPRIPPKRLRGAGRGCEVRMAEVRRGGDGRQLVRGAPPDPEAPWRCAGAGGFEAREVETEVGGSEGASVRELRAGG